MQFYPGRFTELILRDDVHKSSGVFSSLDEQTQAMLKNVGIGTKGALFNKAMRVHERYIEQGEQIYALGTVYSKNGTRVMDEESPLIVSDHSELRLLSKFTWQVFINGLVGIFIGAILVLYFINR